MGIKKITNKNIILIIMLIIICLSSLLYFLVSHKTNENSSIPFPYTYTKDIASELLIKNIIQTIGHPEAVPIITNQDMFSAIIYNNKNENNNKIYKLASTFRIHAIEEEKSSLLSYQLHLSENNLVNITFRDKIENELSEGHQLNYHYTLQDMLDALKHFPADEYQELTAYGKGEADLYQLRFNDGLNDELNDELSDGLNVGEKFSYNYLGAIKNESEWIGIPFLITNMNLIWGGISIHAPT